MFRFFKKKTLPTFRNKIQDYINNLNLKVERRDIQEYDISEVSMTFIQTDRKEFRLKSTLYLKNYDLYSRSIVLHEGMSYETFKTVVEKIQTGISTFALDKQYSYTKVSKYELSNDKLTIFARLYN